MNLRQKLISTTTLIVGVTLLAAPTALAQASGAAPQTSNPTAEEKKDSTEVENIVVTGTRISKREYTSAAPVQIITTEETDLRGIPDAAGAILTSTAAASSFQINDQLTGFVATGQGGQGSQQVSLRGLGTQRTLTLLNGRRAGPAGTRGQVQAFDLNTVPASQVERYEILKDGASSIYGSDAIGGVINIITKKNLNGGEANAFASIPTQYGGKQYRLDATYGRTWDKGYFNVSGNYQENKVLRRRDRKETRCAIDYVFDPITGAQRDYVDPLTGKLKCYDQNTGYISASVGNLVRESVIPGYVYPTSTNGNNSTFPGWARFNRAGFPQTYLYTPSTNRFWDASSVISPSVNKSLTFMGGYFLSDRAEAYTELLYDRRESHQYGAAQFFPSFGTLAASNPNNELHIASQPVSPYASDSNQDVDYYRGVLGLRGDIPSVLGRDWKYDVYAQYALSVGRYDNGPRAYLDRYVALTSANVACTNTPAGGNFSHFDCAALPQGVPWTSQRILDGYFNDAERSFLFVNENGWTTYSHAYVEGVLSTDKLFTLPAGDVGFAAGAQFRREALNDIPGYNARNQNIALFSSAGQTKGSDEVSEAFAELDLPIFKDNFLAKSVSLDISGRYSDYKSYGSTTTYKVGLNWQITDEYRLRFSKGNSFRAPALYELFLGAQTSFQGQTAIDPCINFGNGGDPVIAAACAALGIPPDYTAAGSSSASIASIGGKGVLRAETADTYDVGFVWTPTYLPLSVALDYYYTDIQDAVAQFGAANIIEQCLRGHADFCTLFNRDPTTHFITTVNNAFVNINDQKAAGLDLQLRWSADVPWGHLTIDSEHNWKLVDKINQLGGETESVLGNTFNYNGPQYNGNVYLNLDHGPFTLFYGVDMIGHASDSVEAGGHVLSSTKYGDVNASTNSANCAAAKNQCVYFLYENKFWFTQSVSLRYRKDQWTLQAGVNNLADRGPPLINTGEFRVGSAMLNGYDMRGRRVFFRIGKKF